MNAPSQIGRVAAGLGVVLALFAASVLFTRSASPSRHQIDAALRLRHPALIKRCVDWPEATAHFSDLVTLDELLTLDGVRAKPRGQDFVNEEFGLPAQRARELGLVPGPTERVIEASVSPSEFALRSDNETKYYARALHETAYAAVAEHSMPGREAFEGVNGRAESFLWLGLAGNSARTHYDTADNFNVQLAGSKRFVLAPPALWTEFKLNPSFHLSRRQASVDLLARRFSARSVVLDRAGVERVIMSIVLEPGDCLFIPAYTFHRVEVLEPANGVAANLNTFTPSRARALERALASPTLLRPTHFVEQLLEADRARVPGVFPGAVWYYIRRLTLEVLRSIHASCGLPTIESPRAADVDTFLDSALSTRHGIVKGDGEGRCPALRVEPEDEGPLALAAETAGMVAAEFGCLHGDDSSNWAASEWTDTRAIAEIILADVVEGVAVSLLTLERVRGFFECGLLELRRAHANM